MLQACEDVVALIGTIVDVPDSNYSRPALSRKLETVSVNKGLKEAVRLGLAFHTSCKSSGFAFHQQQCCSVHYLHSTSFAAAQ